MAALVAGNPDAVVPDLEMRRMQVGLNLGAGPQWHRIGIGSNNNAAAAVDLWERHLGQVEPGRGQRQEMLALDRRSPTESSRPSIRRCSFARQPAINRALSSSRSAAEGTGTQ